MFNQRVNALNEVKDSLFNKVRKKFTFVPIPAEMFPFRRAAEEKMPAVSEIVRIVAGTLTEGSFIYLFIHFFAPEVKEPLSRRRQVLSRTQEEEEEGKKK